MDIRSETTKMMLRQYRTLRGNEPLRPDPAEGEAMTRIRAKEYERWADMMWAWRLLIGNRLVDEALGDL